MTSRKASEPKRVSPEEIQATAEAAVIPAHCTDVCMVVVVERGGRLDNGDPSGLGVTTQYGPAWVTEGKYKSEPIALYDNMKDGYALHALLSGEEGELWDRKRRRREAADAMEAAEEDAEASKSSARATTALDDGSGSRPRKRSSEKPSDSTPPREIRRKSPGRSRRTSSRRS